METTTRIRPGLDQLVAGIRIAVARYAGDPHRTAFAVADVLRASMPTPDLLAAKERQGTEGRLEGHLLHAEADFSVKAVIWRPGQFTSVHDHIAWCAFGVLQGIEYETIYRDDGDHLTEIGRTANRVGDVSGFAPPGDIHRVHNTGSATAISLHVYGADLREVASSVRRTYDLPIQQETRRHRSA
jgi:predicted metal-dependent enzyme (double-stranded beta helix superfamily)